MNEENVMRNAAGYPVKEQVLAELRKLKESLPSDKLNTDEQIRMLKDSLIELSRNIINKSDEEVTDNSEMERQIAEKEAELVSLKSSVSGLDSEVAKTTIQRVNELNEIINQNELKYSKASTIEEKEKLIDIINDSIKERDMIVEPLIKSNKELIDLYDDFGTKEYDIREELIKREQFKNDNPDKPIPAEYYAKNGDYSIMLQEIMPKLENEINSKVGAPVDNSEEISRIEREIEDLKANSTKVESNDNEKTFQVLDKRILGLEALKENGWDNTKSHLDNLINDYQSGKITEPVLLSELTNLIANQNHLYDFTPEEREIELKQIETQKNELESKISTLEENLKGISPDESINDKLIKVNNQMLAMYADEIGIDVKDLAKNPKALDFDTENLTATEILEKISDSKNDLEAIRKEKSELGTRLLSLMDENLTKEQKADKKLVQKYLKNINEAEKKCLNDIEWYKLKGKRDQLLKLKEKDKNMKSSKNWDRTLMQLELDKSKQELSALNSREDYLTKSYGTEEKLNDLVVLLGGKKTEKESTTVVAPEEIKEEVAEEKPKTADTEEKETTPVVEEPKEEEIVSVTQPGHEYQVTGMEKPDEKTKNKIIGWFNKNKKAVILAALGVLGGGLMFVAGLACCAAHNHFQKADTLPLTPIIPIIEQAEKTPEVTPKPTAKPTPKPTETPEIKPGSPSGPSTPDKPSNPTPGPSDPTPGPVDPTPGPVDPTPVNNETHQAVLNEIKTNEGGTTTVSTGLGTREHDLNITREDNKDYVIQDPTTGEVLVTLEQTPDGKVTDEEINRALDEAEKVKDRIDNTKVEEINANAPEVSGNEQGIETAPKDVQNEIINQAEDLFKNPDNIASTDVIGDFVDSAGATIQP